MTSQQWANLWGLLDTAIDEPSTRPALVDELRRRDPEVCAELERLLADLEAEEAPQDDPPPAAAIAGLQIGPYKVVREIGRGGAGTVFFATRDEAGVQVPFALKLLRRDFMRGTSSRSFHRELRALARLDHPNIARLLDWGSVPGGLFYLALEYVDGLPITRYCAEMGLGIDSRIDLFLQVCVAVEHAHRHLVVHRDLKPSTFWSRRLPPLP
jgi:serine/threonine-protein kinase